MDISPRARIRPIDSFTHVVTYPCGGSVRITEVANARPGSGGKAFSVRVVEGEREQQVWIPGGFGGRYAQTFADAFTHGWAAAAKVAEQQPWKTAKEVHALALECNSDRALFTKTVKRIAKQRFGVKLGARGGRGTGYGWVKISAPKKHTGYDLAVLRLLSGSDTAHDEHSVRPCGGERVAIICRLAGYPLPEGFKVRAPEWD